MNSRLEVPKATWPTLSKILDGASSVAVLVMAGATLWVLFGRQRVETNSTPLPSGPVSFKGAPIEGGSGAAVGVIEFSDFQCPFCGTFARETLSDLRLKYLNAGKVFLAFKNLPLEAIHPLARGAAEGAVCAGKQDKFWPMHDLLFQNSLSTTREGVLGNAEKLGLDQAQFRSCIDSEARDAVTKDTSAATALRINTTPTFLIGTVGDAGSLRVRSVLVGNQPITAFEKALDPLLKETGGR